MDVVGVVTPFFAEVRRFCMAIRLSSFRVQLGVQEVEGKKEDREGQVEVEEEKRLKEVRSCMTMDEK